jgi:hypothetical protein
MRGPVSTDAKAKTAHVQAVPRSARAVEPANQNGTQAPTLARASHIRRADGNQALREIFAPLPEGFRHGWIGDSGMGKSFANSATIEAALAKGLLGVAHDDTKLDAQCPGFVRVNVAQLEARPPNEEEDAAGAICFRGNPYDGTVVEVEEVAAFALRLARGRVRTLLVIDELDRAVTPGGKELCSLSLRTALTQGRALGLCVSWTTQSPARAPKEVLDQATTIGIFRLGPRAMNYVDGVLFFDADMLTIVPTLQVGDFVLHRPGSPWDRTVYKFRG